MSPSIRDFLTVLFDGIDGYVDVRTVNPVEQTFVHVGEWDRLESFAQTHRDRNCFVGVAARRTAGDGSLANCGALPALFVDLDLKAISEADGRQRLQSSWLQPSITVHSGGGFHAYWLLREPLDLHRASGPAKALLRRLARHLGADIATAEPARILRLPNTRNFKYQPARSVAIECFDPDRRYNASDFDDWLPSESNHRPAPLPSDVIAEGFRNRHLTRLAGTMRRPGMGEDAILAALRIENTNRCRPPLSDAEVCTIARSIARYAPQRTAPIVRSRPLELTTLRDLLAEPNDVTDWLVEDRIPIGGLVMLAGKPKSGKSTAARDLALAVARGDSWVGFQCVQRPVMYVALEDRRTDVKHHFRAMGATGEEPLRFLFREGDGDLVARLHAVAAEDRPGLIIVDTLQRLIKARDLNDYAEVTTKLTPILSLARESGAAVVLIHHAGKSLRPDALDSVLGSTALAGSVDNLLLVRRSDQYRTLQSVQRVGPDLPETVLILAANGQTSNGGTRQDADDCQHRSAMVQALASGPLTRAAVLDSIDARKTDKLRALKQLVDAGTITRSGTGHRNEPYTYAMATIEDGGSQVPALSQEPPIANPPSPEMPSDSAENSGSHPIDLSRPCGNHQAGAACGTDLFPHPAASEGPLPPLLGPPAQFDEVGQ